MQTPKDTLTQLFAGADQRDWPLVESTMDDSVLLDYTSMAGGTPAQLTPRQITDAWAANTRLPVVATERVNRKVVDSFFVALETQQFDRLKTIFADNGRQLNPYAPEGFPKSFDGAEGIYKQYSGLTAQFGQMTFPRQIFATEDPNFFFVQFKGAIDIKAGGRYENDYLGTFRLQGGKITEYTEYFNQVVMAKAFGITLT